MAAVICEVIDRDPTTPVATVAIRVRNDPAQSRNEFLQVPHHFLHDQNGKTYLGVDVVERDRGTGFFLIGFPFEADSGAGRAWVESSSLLRSDEVVKR
jgi:hypothetical protein